MVQRLFAWLALAAAAGILVGVLFGLAWWLGRLGFGDEVRLPLLAITGVVVLIGTLALVAMAFALMSMSDKTQALGLPNGSVRAVIALSLVVIFAILVVFLYGSLNSGGQVRELSCLTADERDRIVQGTRPGDVQPFQESAVSNDGKTPCPPRPAPAAAADAAKANPNATPTVFFTVYYRQAANPASEDFAKQLLVLIGTLVTSVAGFYFGAKAVADAQDTTGAGGSPSLIGVNPGNVPAGGDAVALTITGSNLNDVTHAQLISGAAQITDPGVVSNATQVKAKFAIPANAPIGAWDVVVIDDIGRSARLTGGLTVTAPAPAGGAGAAAVAPIDAGQLAKQATAIRAIATGVKSRLDALLAKTPLATLQTEVTQLGDAGQSLQPQLASAEQATDTLQAKAAACATDAERAEAAATDAASAGGDATRLKAIADRLAQLSADATQAGHDFDTAFTAYDRASRDILARVASG